MLQLKIIVLITGENEIELESLFTRAKINVFADRRLVHTYCFSGENPQTAQN